ncbi:TetR/AcrR family transcriptional regulator [Kineosporia rhizophila]|uniref:TetR/AcrR family transcriptional regulator n=1 Tax=Kineosporia TaxID=49184 RepID=UPI001E438AE1|nr:MULTISPECIES: TetR/AcrR family transcriptional regulator [Kineosporia]MCE0535388.1 TetR/AcrR family transcriptional regulator [Kineosporia rhizophila]GLY16831.1 TetR family transcriptional regulator [Kineosporia sp. NBRC 101677]
MDDQMPRLRADAQDNRDRLLEAAHALFAEHGLDVTMRQIARRAGVGPATLYRRFPTRQDLIEAAFANELQACSSIVEDGCGDPDPWLGLCSIIERLSVLNARNHGFVQAFHAENATIGAREHRACLLRMVTRLAERAKLAGALRQDFTADDFVLVLLAGRGLTTLPPPQREAAARRFAALSIDGLRARA